MDTWKKILNCDVSSSWNFFIYQISNIDLRVIVIAVFSLNRQICFHVLVYYHPPPKKKKFKPVVHSWTKIMTLMVFISGNIQTSCSEMLTIYNTRLVRNRSYTIYCRISGLYKLIFIYTYIQKSTVNSFRSASQIGP